MNQVGIVVASQLEAKSLKLLPRCQQQFIALSGIGAEAATLSATQLITKGATHLLSWGLAGGLADQVYPGNILLPDTLYNETGEQIAVDSSWHKMMVSTFKPQYQLHTGALVQVKQVLTKCSDKRSYQQYFDATAIDMESFSIAKVAKYNNIPFLCLRVVIDPSWMELPEIFENSIETLSTKTRLKLAKKIFLQPKNWLPSLQLMRYYFIAMHRLKQIANTPQLICTL